MRDGRIVEVMEVVGVEGSRVLFERYLPLHDTVLKRYRVARRRVKRVSRHGNKRAPQDHHNSLVNSDYNSEAAGGGHLEVPQWANSCSEPEDRERCWER